MIPFAPIPQYLYLEDYDYIPEAPKQEEIEESKVIVIELWTEDDEEKS